jgi:type VI protein secretion system component VasF
MGMARVKARRARGRLIRLHARLHAPQELERGDVPGWVMITLMTAVIVVLIWGIASSSLQNLLSSAFSKVTDQSNK